MGVKKGSSEETVLFDVSRVFRRGRSKKSSASPARYAWIILLIIPVLLGAYFRMYPVWLPAADSWAQSGVYSNIQNSIRSEIQQQFPNLPADRVNVEADKRWKTFYEQNGAQVDAAVKQNAAYLRSQFQFEQPDGSQHTYILDIDPYYQFIWIRNYVQYGRAGEEIKDGKPYHPLMNAPKGSYPKVDFLMVVHGLIYKIAHTLNPDVTIFLVVYYVTPWIAAFSAIPAFFIIRRKAGNVGAFVGAALLALSPQFIGRAAAGQPDTDAFNVLFPLLAMWLFIESVENKNRLGQIIFAALGGLSIGLFSLTWVGWWYIFDFLVVAGVGVLCYRALRLIISKSNMKKILNDELFSRTALVLGVFILFSVVFTWSLVGSDQVVKAVTGPLQFQVIKDATSGNAWPNVYTTVAELNPAGLSQVIGSVGGKLFFFLAGLGIIFTLLGKRMSWRHWVVVGASALILLYAIGKPDMSGILFLALFTIPVIIGLILNLNDDSVDVMYSIILIVWFLGTIYASFKGIRFILLMIPAFAIAFGIAIGSIHRYAMLLVKSSRPMVNRSIAVAFAVLLCLSLIQPLRAADAAGKGQTPLISDGWYDALVRIDKEMPPDTIITSWWDFGHWFRAVARRGVTFDGASQNGPNAHWVGKALLTPDENLSVGLVRMLDCGQNDAYNFVFSDIYPGDAPKSVDLIETVVRIPTKEGARDVLLNAGISSDKADVLLSSTHCEPPPGIFITSGDMVGKSGVWGHFGAWDFKRALVYEAVKGLPADKARARIRDGLGVSVEEADRLYSEARSLRSEEAANQWIAEWPSYIMDGWRGCSPVNGTLVQCPIGLNAGRDSSGNANVVINSLSLDLDSPQNASFDVVFVKSGSSQAISRTRGAPSGVVVVRNDSMIRTPSSSQAFSLDVLYDESNNRMMVVPPSLSQSMFTRLFYLEGRTTSHFEKFSDTTAVTGQRVLIWKILWPNASSG